MKSEDLTAALRYHARATMWTCTECPYDEIRRSRGSCLDKMLTDAADALEAAEKRIAELESQMPKEGEWRDDNGAVVPLDDYGYTTDLCQCSVCGDWLIASDEYHMRGRYCPNCGSRMAKGEQE